MFYLLAVVLKTRNKPYTTTLYGIEGNVKMIAVIIKFKVKPNQEKVFVENWKQLTKFIYEYENSLGSRLHKEEDLNFIAYAQWPDKETLHNTDSKLPEEALEVRKRMRNACEKVEKLYELELTEDLLK